MNSKNFILILLAIFIFLMVFIALIIGWNKQDKTDCFKWQYEATIFSEYWVTEWQKEQCDYFNIKIDAPVKKASEI